MSADAAYPVKVIRNVMIPMPDGVHLAANLFLPEAEGRYPGIFTFTPYLKDGRAGWSQAPQQRHFASRGYAAMQVDFRGVGCSEGINPYPFDPQERADGHQIVEWMAAQPWCTGDIGIWGTSYGGITALSIASTRPPHLKAIVPLNATVDNYEWFLRTHGCQELMYCDVGWAARMAASNLTPPIIQDPAGHWMRVWRERLEANQPWILSWHGQPPDPEFWLRRRIPYDQIEVPYFGICGWYDAYTAPTFMVYEAVRGPKRVLIGPWKHVFPDLAQWHAAGIAHEMDRWWDRWLKEIDNGVDREPSVTIYVMGAEKWRHETSWPVSRTRPARLYLDHDRRLVDSSTAVAAGSDKYAYDSRVGTGSIDWHSGLAALPLPGDQSFDDHLSLAYTAAPLDQDTEILGAPVAHVFVSATEPEIQLAVKLCVVGPDDCSAAHLFGTDELGRDLLSRVLAGTRLSLGAALEAELLVVFVGMFVGLLAGYQRGLFSEIIMRLIDVFLAFPGLLLAIAIVAVLGPSLQSAILAVSITWWPVYARLTRSAVLTVREQEYITAARAIGATEWRIMLGYVLPNSVTPASVQFTLSIGAALETIAGLSFLGFGAQPPTPEWGALIFAGFRYILVAPWYSTFPGVAIVLVVLIFSALGDALQLSLGGV